MTGATRSVELRPITMDDLPLYEALLTDPRMMTELGGPLARVGLADKLRGIVDDVEAGTVWFDVIVEDGVDVGTVCVWDPDEADASTEIGWMVLPEHQGREVASTAVQEVLRRARSEPRWTHIDAHPGVTNAASNAICRRAGFTKLGEHDVDYVGRTLRCAHWRVDVS